MNRRKLRNINEFAPVTLENYTAHHVQKNSLVKVMDKNGGNTRVILHGSDGIGKKTIAVLALKEYGYHPVTVSLATDVDWSRSLLTCLLNVARMRLTATNKYFALVFDVFFTSTCITDHIVQQLRVCMQKVAVPVMFVCPTSCSAVLVDIFSTFVCQHVPPLTASELITYTLHVVNTHFERRCELFSRSNITRITSRAHGTFVGCWQAIDDYVRTYTPDSPDALAKRNTLPPHACEEVDDDDYHDNPIVDPVAHMLCKILEGDDEHDMDELDHMVDRADAVSLSSMYGEHIAEVPARVDAMRKTSKCAFRISRVEFILQIVRGFFNSGARMISTGTDDAVAMIYKHIMSMYGIDPSMYHCVCDDLPLSMALAQQRVARAQTAAKNVIPSIYFMSPSEYHNHIAAENKPKAENAAANDKKPQKRKTVAKIHPDQQQLWGFLHKKHKTDE